MSVLERLQAETLDPLEVAAVVGHERQIMLERGRSDQEIEVADNIPSGSEPSACPPEQLTGVHVDADDRDASEEVREIPLIPFGVRGVVNRCRPGIRLS